MDGAAPPAEALPRIPDRAAFLRWAEGRHGRFERVDGSVIRMNAERAGHVQVKTRIWQALDRAVREAGLQAQAFGDGMTVEIDERTDYEPDAAVNLGPSLGFNALALPNPVIVVEVASPGTQSIDTGLKLAGYLRVPFIRHYLIVDGEKRRVVHHARLAADRTEARVLTTGPLRLDPPGLTVTVDDFFVDLQD